MLAEFLLIFVVGFLLTVTLTNCLFWPRVQTTTQQFPPQVSVLIPARNEELNLAACLDSVLIQGEVVKEILVYNDHSTDQTSTILSAYLNRHTKILSLAPLSLPAGWCGKNFACQNLADAASGDWLLFLDADARLLENAVSGLVATAQARHLTFLSSWPKIEMLSWSERMLMPLLNFAVFSIYPALLSLLSSAQFRTNPKLGLAHGACLFFKRDEYNAFGGHHQVKDQIFEDTRLSQLWRATGRNGLCLDGQAIVKLRMYRNLTEIWQGFQKNFFPAFKKASSFWLFIALHCLILLAPFIALLIVPSVSLLLVVLGIILMRAALAIRFHHPALSVVLHPVGQIFLIAIGLSSYVRCRTGKGVSWKGRTYQGSAKL